MTPGKQSTKTTETTNGPKPAPADADKALLDEILNRAATFTPFQEAAPIKLTVRIVKQYFARPTKKGKECPDWQAERFIALCKARALNPWVGDAFIVGFDADDGPEFSLITAHQALLKRAEMHPDYKGLESGVIVRRVVGKDEAGHDIAETHWYEGAYVEPGDILVGGWAKVYRSDRDHPAYVRINLQAFNKGFGRWKFDAAGMIVKCAEGGALRKSFPNTLGGLVTEEEGGAKFEEKEKAGVPLTTIADISRQLTEAPMVRGDAILNAPADESASMSDWAGGVQARAEGL